ncbi:MAG: hypothetical protein KF749_02755, partial [Bacteroidetes bacterium]|nr:hypothetical protein [Bacteroidota bacterium]
MRTKMPQAVIGNGRLQAIVETPTPWILLAFALLHVPLALLMRGERMIATVHAFTTLILGLVFVIKSRNLVQVVYVVAYIAG